MVKRQITIFNDEWQPVIAFTAPADKYVARGLWVFLVENLQPGVIVELSNGASEITRPSGATLPIELYKKLMDQE